MNILFYLGDEVCISPEEMMPLQNCDGRSEGLRVGATVHTGVGSRGAGKVYVFMVYVALLCVVLVLVLVLVVYALLMLLVLSSVVVGVSLSCGHCSVLDFIEARYRSRYPHLSPHNSCLSPCVYVCQCYT